MSDQKPYLLDVIAKQLNAELVQNAEHKVLISNLLIDSRQMISPDGCLFFALKTNRNDGHKYIHLLIGQGVRNFVVDHLPDDTNDLPKDVRFLKVKNTLHALQRLAAWHRQSFDVPVIGITGSNGKTIVKEWLFQLLSPDKQIVRSPKSFNSQIGVPLSVWQIEPGNQMAIFEAGISEPGEMDAIQAIIRPTIGVFTNIGPAHNENFIHLQQKVGEKLKLFTKVDTLVYCSDHTEVQSGIIRSQLLHTIKSFTWSSKVDADLNIKGITKSSRQTKIDAEFRDQAMEISIPFIDDASIENAIHCWCVMLLLDFDPSIIAKRMLLLNPIAMRLELKEGINNCTIINDTYNSDVHSLAIALDFLNQQNQHRFNSVILSDILESGRDESDLYRQIASLLSTKGVKSLIGIGPALKRQTKNFSINSKFYDTTEAFLSSVSVSDFQNQAVLIKGARIFGFERISQLLQQKAHETVLEINLNNLIANLNYYRSLIKPNTRIMLMVKAFSYGSGSYEIANVLQFHQVEYLAVAYADEGVELRNAGIRLPIMVMSPEEHSFDAMLKHELEPEVFSFRILDLLELAINRIDIKKKPVKIHVKLDTGMHRLGFNERELPELAERILANPILHVQSVFSHLAASDNAQHDDFSHQQVSMFENNCQYLREKLSHSFDRHILNSAGISRFPEANFEMVRLGIGVYGVPLTQQEEGKIETVISLKSSLTQIKEVSAGESIGYNRSSYTNQKSKIGIVPIGYADGLPRSLSNGRGQLFVKNNAAPIIGDVCMDMCMIDLTGIDADEGDEVVVFDQNHSLKELARDAGTIPYEILTGISRRVKRVYFQE